MEWPNRSQIIQMILLLLSGLLGGLIAWQIGLPLPFMIGGLLTTIPFVARANSANTQVFFSRFLRKWFVGVIGALIGGTFTPDLVVILPSLSFSIAAVAVYVVAAHAMGYLICRWFGRYDQVTAFYSSMPGGLIEAILLGERNGGDVRVLTMMHFLRVLFVVTTFPIAFYLWSGDAVGSAAGQGFEQDSWNWHDLIIIMALTGTGLLLGRILRLPASHLLGPLLVSSIVCGTGIWQASSPIWLLYIAQLVVGVGLGTQFAGASLGLFIRVLWTSLAQLGVMVGLTVGLAYLMFPISDFDFQTLILSYAPGGVSEMGLIALSLSISPVVVAAHHTVRIFITVIIGGLSERFLTAKED